VECQFSVEKVQVTGRTKTTQSIRRVYLRVVSQV